MTLPVDGLQKVSIDFVATAYTEAENLAISLLHDYIRAGLGLTLLCLPFLLL